MKRGLRFVHGDKELVEKLGRNDPCPCGSGLSFQAVLPGVGLLSTAAGAMTIGGVTRWGRPRPAPEGSFRPSSGHLMPLPELPKADRVEVTLPCADQPNLPISGCALEGYLPNQIDKGAQFLPAYDGDWGK